MPVFKLLVEILMIFSSCINGQLYLSISYIIILSTNGLSNSYIMIILFYIYKNDCHL